MSRGQNYLWISETSSKLRRRDLKTHKSLNISKCFTSSLKLKPGFFLISPFEERFQETPFLWRIILTVGLTVGIKLRLKNFSGLVWRGRETLKKCFSLPLSLLVCKWKTADFSLMMFFYYLFHIRCNVCKDVCDSSVQPSSRETSAG